MRTLYNILFTIFFWIASPFYFLKMWRRGAWRRGFAQRFGRYTTKLKQSLTNRHVLWMHAVSVGEVNICIQLIRALEPKVPNLKIIVSTTTSTGMGELEKKLPSHIGKIYYPIDRYRIVQRALSTIHPEVIVLVEAEIWPNFLWRAYQMEIPVFLVNARLSDRSYRRYKRFGFLFRPLFAGLAGVGCQNEHDAQRLQALGVPPEAIHLVGNLKYDAAARLDERRLLDVPALLQKLGVQKSTPLLIGASTHPGEEAILVDCLRRLKTRFPELFLILVPRHFERGKEVGRELQSKGVKFVYRSELTGHSKYEPGEIECLLVNTTGELKYFYQHGDVIFVGKSLAAEGGQNPIEPAALGKAIVFGPNMQNFDVIAKAFVERGGAIQVKDATGLETAIAELLKHPERRDVLGQHALRVVQENLGAIDRTVNMIVERLDPEEVYVAGRK
jgi:3-deoxy-D-manno-octulosonic-acid transferase